MILCEIYFVSNSKLSEISLINLLKFAKNLPFCAIILRENQDYYDKFAKEILEFCKFKNIKFITHSNINFALKNKLSNIHFSFDEFHQIYQTCPEILAKFSEISVSIHSLNELNFVTNNGANFAILGSVFRTKTHLNQNPLGLDKFSKIVAKATIPVFAIGGVKFENINLLQNTNIKGVCMMREIYKTLG